MWAENISKTTEKNIIGLFALFKHVKLLGLNIIYVSDGIKTLQNRPNLFYLFIHFFSVTGTYFKLVGHNADNISYNN